MLVVSGVLVVLLISSVVCCWVVTGKEVLSGIKAGSVVVGKSGNKEVIESLDPLSVLIVCDWLLFKVVVVIKETVLAEEDASFIADELMVH